MTTDSRVRSPVLVGRADEIAWMCQGLARVRGGAPATLLIGGDAGIGKSRLVAEFAALAGPARVLTGACLELGAVGLPFAPFSAILADIAGDRGAAGIAALLPHGASRDEAGCELTRLLPRIAGEQAPGERPFSERPPGEARERLFRQMRALLRGLAASSPVVLVIEDAQWADESSKELLGFLIGSQQELDGVLIIITFRSDELHRGHPLRKLLASLAGLRWVQRAGLPGLSRDESGELIARILRADPDPSLADMVYQQTKGNPLFIEELVRCGCKPVSQAGQHAPPLPRALSGSLPGSLRDLLLVALRRLPEQTQDTLRAASVGGQRTPNALLTAVTGADAETLAAVLWPAVERGVLVADGDGWAFRHALIGEAIHQDLLPDDHTMLHHQFATALRADPDLLPAGRTAMEQAQHWYHAHHPALALSSAWQAAAEAGRALAHAAQLTMLARVLEMWASVPDAQQRTGADHVAVLEEAAAVAGITGERELGIAFATAALDEVDMHSDPLRAARLLRSRAQLKKRAGRLDAADEVHEMG